MRNHRRGCSAYSSSSRFFGGGWSFRGSGLGSGLAPSRGLFCHGFAWPRGAPDGGFRRLVLPRPIAARRPGRRPIRFLPVGAGRPRRPAERFALGPIAARCAVRRFARLVFPRTITTWRAGRRPIRFLPLGPIARRPAERLALGTVAARCAVRRFARLVFPTVDRHAVGPTVADSISATGRPTRRCRTGGLPRLVSLRPVAARGPAVGGGFCH